MATDAPPVADRQSRMAIAGHPIHAMLNTFPIVFLTTVVPCDLAWIVTGDPFWARLSLWLAGGGALTGLVAGTVGAIDFFIIPEVRRITTAWSHFVAAVLLIAIAFVNWLLRLADPTALIVPWALMLSILGLVMVSVAAWMGANLVFDENIAISEIDEE